MKFVGVTLCIQKHFSKKKLSNDSSKNSFKLKKKKVQKIDDLLMSYLLNRQRSSFKSSEHNFTNQTSHQRIM